MLSVRISARSNLEESGLIAASKANQAASDTVVSVWGLITTSSELEIADDKDTFALPYRVSGYFDESVIGLVDRRKLVAKEDFGPGSKYRCKR